jgi:hypothetical protein
MGTSIREIWRDTRRYEELEVGADSEAGVGEGLEVDRLWRIRKEDSIRGREDV